MSLFADDPRQRAAKAFTLGRDSYMREDLGGAEAAFREALALDPQNTDSRIGLGTTLLKAGRLAEGFPLFDLWRTVPSRRDRMAPELPFTLWRGQDVAGKRVLVWSEDGFGDQIMYARFARALKDRGGIVSWLCPPELALLFGRGLGIHAIAADRPVEFSDFDYYCPSSALPVGFNLDLSTLPGDGYIDPPAPVPTPPGAVGVMTAGNPNNVQGRGRELPPELAAELTSLPGAIDLSPAATGARTFQDTAALIAGLDLVISVDTAVAHLAGALGKPVWILTPYPADWRWLSGRDDSPWYASARLFRQPATGAWRPVLDQVHAALAARRDPTA